MGKCSSLPDRREKKRRGTPRPSDRSRVLDARRRSRFACTASCPLFARSRHECKGLFDNLTDFHRRLPFVFFCLRRNGTILNVNTSATAPLGEQDRASLLGKRLASFLGGPNRLAFARNLARLPKAGHIEWEGEWRGAAGVTLPVVITVRPFRRGGGLPVLRALLMDITSRKRVENALRDSEARYRTLVEQIPAVTYVASLDEASTTLFVSPQIKALIGFSPEEYQADPDIWRKRLHPEDRDRVMKEIRRSHAKGSLFRSEYRMLARDGRVVWFRDEAVIVRDNAGRPMCLQGVMTDITETKEAEEALRKSEERSRIQHKGAPVPSYTWQWNGKDFLLVDFNEAARKITKSRIEERLGITASALFPTRPDILDDLHRCLRKRLTIRREMEYHMVSTGESKIMDVSYVFLPPDLVMVHTMDITARKRAQEALQASEEKYRVVVEAIRHPLFTVDRHGVYLFMNTEAARRLGGAPKDFIGKTMWDLFPKEIADGQMKAVASVFQTGKPTISCRESVVRGQWRYYEAMLHPIVAQDGWIPAVLVIASDKTDIRRTEEQYQLLVERSPNLILRVDEHGTVLFANRRALAHVAKPKPQVIGKSLHQIFPAALANSRSARLRQVLHNNKTTTFLDTHQEKRFVCCIAPLPQTHPREVILIITDVTEREEARERAAELSQQIMHVQEDVLSRISRELHDQVGQLITAIDIELETARKAQESHKGFSMDRFKRLRGLTHAATDAVRGLCRSLRSPVIDGVGLIAVMRSHIDDFRNRTGVEITFRCALRRSGIGSNAALGFFRIMQEALTNVARHARATTATVALCRTNGHTVLEIADNGNGFNPDDKPPHRSGGLQGMRERTQLFGGQLLIQSRPGQGTRIRVSAPPVPRREEAPL